MHLLTLWCTFHTLWRHDVLFDVMKYFLHNETFWHHIKHNSWHYEVLFDMITYFLYLLSCHTLWRYDVLLTWHTFWWHTLWASWHIFDGITYFAYFLAPPAERQRSFSNADSSVVGVNFSLKMLIYQKRSYNFLRKVPMYCKNVYLVRLNYSKGHLLRSERSNLAHFSLGGNFLKNCSKTFFNVWKVKFGYFATFWPFSLSFVYNFLGMIFWSTVKRWNWLNYFKGRKGQVWLRLPMFLWNAYTK